MDSQTATKRRGIALGLLLGLMLAAIPLVSHLPRPVVLTWQWPAASLHAALMQGDEVVASLSLRRRCKPAPSAPMPEAPTPSGCEAWSQNENRQAGDRVTWPVRLQPGEPYRLHVRSAARQDTYPFKIEAGTCAGETKVFLRPGGQP